MRRCLHKNVPRCCKYLEFNLLRFKSLHTVDKSHCLDNYACKGTRILDITPPNHETICAVNLGIWFYCAKAVVSLWILSKNIWRQSKLRPKTPSTYYTPHLSEMGPKDMFTHIFFCRLIERLSRTKWRWFEWYNFVEIYWWLVSKYLT